MVLTLDSVIKHQTNTALKLDNIDWREVDSHKYLGLIFTKNLSWHQHIDSICVKAGQLITIFFKISKATPKNVLLTLYLSFIRSMLEYGSIVYDNSSKQDSDNLEKTQMRAAKVILGCIRNTSHTKMRSQLAVPSLEVRRKIQLLTLFYKILNGLAPPYLSDNWPALLRDVSRYAFQCLMNCNQFLPILTINQV